jgi:hypothetical protein
VIDAPWVWRQRSLRCDEESRGALITVPSWAALAAVAAVALLTSSCAASGLAFRQDDGVRITSPRELQQVDPPFLMQWATRLPRNTRYAVFIDQVPMPPGQSLRQYADDKCQGTDSCPGATAESLTSWLEQIGIYRTDAPRLRVNFVICKNESTEQATRDIHQAVLVLLGPDGERTGAAAWSVDFRVAQEC